MQPLKTSVTIWILGNVHNCLKMEKVVLESMITLKLHYVKKKR